MSYRDWQRKHPSAPPRMQDLVRDKRRVRLLETIVTCEGKVFQADSVCVVKGASCGKLHLTDKGGRYIRMVRLRQVELADELLLFQPPVAPLKTRMPGIVVEIPPPGPEREKLCERVSKELSEGMGVVNGAPAWFVNRGLELLEVLCPRAK